MTRLGRKEDRFMKRLSRVWLHSALLFLGIACAAHATQLLTNGSFESGLTGWTVTNSTTDGSSWFVTNQSQTPLNGYPTVGPSDGSYYAVTDEVGPGLHAITQAFTDPLGATSAIVSFDVFMNDVYALGGNPQISCVCLLSGTARSAYRYADPYLVWTGRYIPIRSGDPEPVCSCHRGY